VQSPCSHRNTRDCRDQYREWMPPCRSCFSHPWRMTFDAKIKHQIGVGSKSAMPIDL
jgi:hypothetical protein